MVVSPWRILTQLLNLRGNHMTQQVEAANKWVYFIQNVGWLVSIPVALTLVYSNLSGKVDAQEKEIAELRSQLTDMSSRFDTVSNKQNEQTVLLTEIKTLVEVAPTVKKGITAPATQGN
jgi:hypothetical protein